MNSPHSSLFTKSLLASSLALAAAAPSLWAQAASTSVWNGTTSTDWNTAANWTPSGVPNTVTAGVDGTSAVVPVVTLDLTPTGANLIPTQLLVNGGSATSAVTIGSGGKLEILGAAGTGTFIGAGGSAGSLNVQSGGTYIHAGGAFVTGAAATGSVTLGDGGTITVLSTDPANADDFRIGADGGSNGTFVQTGGTFEASSANAGSLEIGAGGNGHGSYSLSGAGSVANIYQMQVGFGGTGTVAQSGGTLTANGNGDLAIAVGWVGTGEYDLSGGTLNSTTRLRIGVGNGSQGTFNQTGGTVNIAGRVDIADSGNSNGTYTISGGALNVTGQGFIVVGGTTGNTTGTFTQNGGTVVVNDGIIAGFNPGNKGTVNLNGGTLSAGRLQVGGSTPGTGSLNFNGGKVIATSSSGGFITGFTLAGTSTPGVTINAGGATIDTNGNSPTVVSPLVGTGSFTKQGAGTLTLNGVNTYAGGTLVSAGILVAGSLGTGNVELASGATLTLNLATALGDLAQIKLDGPAAVLNLNFTGADTIGMLQVNGDFVAAGTYTADQLNTLYSGQFTGTGSLTVTAVPEPAAILLLGLGLGSLFLIRRRAPTHGVADRSA